MTSAKSSTGYKGVSEQAGRYKTEVWKEGAHHNIGSYATSHEAAFNYSGIDKTRRRRWSRRNRRPRSRRQHTRRRPRKLYVRPSERPSERPSARPSARPNSAEVKFMSLSNFKGTGGALGWGGTLTWTAAEMDAINARRKDGDNINTIIVCAMDMLTGDICVWTHDVDLVMYGKYVLTSSTFHVIDPEQTGEPIPPRHRSIRQLQLWLDHISVELASPPKVVIHTHPKGVQDEHYDAMRPNYDKESIHAYGLCCARGDPSLFHAREFLSTRASRFDKPEIGDNFSATEHHRTDFGTPHADQCEQ